MMPTTIVAYLALFATVGFLFVLACLILGKLVRPCAPNPQKAAIYECGEPAVGSGSVQFDLRFYVVALVFLIFEVEVALFFPPAAIFGKANGLRASNSPAMTTEKYFGVSPAPMALVDSDPQKVEQADSRVSSNVAAQANALALASMLDLGVFFAVLLVGFAYVWSRGDLNWVRAVQHSTTPAENAAMAIRLRSDG